MWCNKCWDNIQVSSVFYMSYLVTFLSLALVSLSFSTNYLREITDDMNSLLDRTFSILQKHNYLSPFLRHFNHLQFSINGNKGQQAEKTCQNVQTGMHSDITYSFRKEVGIQCPSSSNSQEFNTIVAIITVGHARCIKFERVTWENGLIGDILETRYFILKHHSLFLLHPLDERPALRDRGSKVLSQWRHGDVKMMCNNVSCTVRCDQSCAIENESIVSFALALRCCNHSSIIDTDTDTTPLADNVRRQWQLPLLLAIEQEKNENATTQLEQYINSGEAEIFSAWLLRSTKKVMHDFYLSAKP